MAVVTPAMSAQPSDGLSSARTAEGSAFEMGQRTADIEFGNIVDGPPLTRRQLREIEQARAERAREAELLAKLEREVAGQRVRSQPELVDEPPVPQAPAGTIATVMAPAGRPSPSSAEPSMPRRSARRVTTAAAEAPRAPVSRRELREQSAPACDLVEPLPAPRRAARRKVVVPSSFMGEAERAAAGTPAEESRHERSGPRRPETASAPIVHGSVAAAPDPEMEARLAVAIGQSSVSLTPSGADEHDATLVRLESSTGGVDSATTFDGGSGIDDGVAGLAAATPASRRLSRAAASPRSRHWVPRLGLLSALGAATIAAPVAATTAGTAHDGELVVVPISRSSALDVLLDAGATAGTVLSAEGTLAEDPEAATRALVSASRSQGREQLPLCDSTGAEANGSLAALDAEVESPGVVMPIQDGVYRLTSAYGYRTPVLGSSNHTGTDYAAPAGTPIHAIAAGEVVHAGLGIDGRSSMLVIVKHEIDGRTVYSWYVHMYPTDVYVQEGQLIEAGHVIGGVGSYGRSTGPHLHLEIHLDDQGTTVDPVAWLAANNAQTMTAAGPVCS